MDRSESNRRLKVLAAYLRTVPESQFDLGSWVGEDWKGKPDLSCGTTACAVGWATTIPEFQQLGLRLYRSDPEYDMNEASPEFEGLHSFTAVSCFFGIDVDKVNYLFMGHRYPLRKRTPNDVAVRILEFVASRERVLR
jgi:hypothetical protein